MKWLFLLNDAPFLAEFFGKVSEHLIKNGDECVVVWNSKISEFNKKRFFPEKARFLSRIDWCLENFNSEIHEFGGLSWKDIFPIFDRFNSSKLEYDEAVKTVKSYCQFFEFIFLNEKPEIIIGEIPSDLYHEAALQFGKKYGAPYLGLEDSKFENRIDIYDERFLCKRCEKDFFDTTAGLPDEKTRGRMNDFISNFTGHVISLGSDNQLKIKISQLNIVRHYIQSFKKVFPSFLEYILNRNVYKKFDYESETILKNSLLAPIKMEERQLKILFHKKYFSKMEESENFFFYPLHYQPESSTSVYATYYCDQLNTIKNIAFCLPFPYKLYVKEHPASIGLRPRDFYKTLRRIPNVVLLSPRENVNDLIKKSSGVIALTGTIGMEAALLGKPSYIFGKVFYNYHPLCRKVSGFDDLKNKIEHDIKQPQDTTNLGDVNIKYIYSYFKNTIEGSIAKVSLNEDTNNYAQICEDIANTKKRIIEEKICP